MNAEADDEQDAEPKAELQGQSMQASALDQSSTTPEDAAGDREADTSAEPADDATAEDYRTGDDTTPDPVYEPDTSKPLYAQGRSDLKPRADDEVDARTKAQVELQKQSQQIFEVRQPAGAATEDDTAEGDRPAPVYEPDTSKPLYAQGRADLKPRASDEQDARAKAQAELKQQSQQTFTPAVSASEAVTKMRAEGKLQSDSSAASSSSAAPAATSAASDQSGPASPPKTGGRAPPGEREAREKAMVEFNRKSQEQQPVTGISSDVAKSRPQAPGQKPDQRLAAERKPLSDQGRTQDLAKGLAEASMSAEPTWAQAQPQRSPSRARQPSPFQAQQGASSMSTTDSAATSLSPASQPQNPFQNLVTAFQGFFGGQAAASSPSLGTSFAPDQASPPALSTTQQAQISPADASSAQRMAASSQALAAGKGEGRVRTEVPVKRYTDVALDGDVTDFVRERGLRAPLLLLAGLAASAAQTLEPLWPVQLDSRGRKRPAPSDDEPLDWQRYQKYDVFNDLLTAAAASPAAQGEQNSPFRALVNMVPQQGVPKYDFLRNVLQGVVDSPADSGPAGTVGPDGKAVRSKYDPFHTLLQRAQADPTWPTEGPGLDPLAAALQDGKLPWKPITSKYDPFQAIFSAEDPTGSSPAPLDPLGSLAQQARQPKKAPEQAARTKLDPFQNLFKVEEPNSEAPALDPLGNLLKDVRQPRPPSVDSKYDPFQAIFNAEGPSSKASTLDPLGNLLQNVRQPTSPSVESKYDPFQAIFNAEGPSSEASTLDPLGNLLEYARQPQWQSVDSKYDPFQAIFNAEGPSSEASTLDPLGNLLQNARQPTSPSVQSKYDPFQAIFNAEGPSSEASTLDPLGNLLESARQPQWQSVDSKYDPFQAIFTAAGPGADTSSLDPLGNLLQAVRLPKQASVDSKYDPFQAMFRAQGPGAGAATLDPVGALLHKGRQPWSSINSKYDPFQAMFNARGGTGEAELDPLPHVIRGIKARAHLALHRRGPGAVPSRLDKYDLVQQVLASNAPAGPVPGFDPVGSLLKSDWVRERRAKRQQARWRPAALEADEETGPGRAPVGQHQARQRAMAALQSRAKQPSGDGQQEQLSQGGRAEPAEHEARQQAMAELQRRTKQPGAALDTQPDDQQDAADRPSEWAGFIYNPYSGDLLPPEDGEDEGDQDTPQPGRSDPAYGPRRSGGGGGSGKPQFVSANPFRGPSSIKRPTQVQALGATAAAMAALSPEAAEAAAPAAAVPKATYDALTVLMHLGCM
ncbi:hypothetical protein ABBQ32_008169 [Trebouxia sp. C0010 RCD-2024]